MALKDEIKVQTDKLKNMTSKERASYIWEYYKWYIIGALIAIIFIVSVIKSVTVNSRPTYLTVTFLNSLTGFNTENVTVESDFVNAQQIDTDKTNIHFDYSLYLDSEKMDQNTYTSQIKFMAQLSAKEIDVICGPESVITGAANAGSYENLEEILPAGMLEDLKNKGYEPFYYTEILDTETEDEIAFELMEAENDGRDISDETKAKLENLETKKYIGGIYIDKCAYLNSQGEHGIYAEGSTDRAVLTIAPGSQNIDHAIEFIKFITQQ